LLEGLKTRARALKLESYALYLVVRDPRTPWYARMVATAVVAYALSPIDLIPDFVPVLGYLDDLVIVPAGIALAVRLVPPEVLADCRKQARERSGRPVSRAGAVIIVAIWVVALVWVALLVRDVLD
jgi:uncharacterized membrane protein YkvA (DUF1232 family)